jgi:hypothetical protein
VFEIPPEGVPIEGGSGEDSSDDGGSDDARSNNGRSNEAGSNEGNGHEASAVNGQQDPATANETQSPNKCKDAIKDNTESTDNNGIHSQIQFKPPMS